MYKKQEKKVPWCMFYRTMKIIYSQRVNTDFFKVFSDYQFPLLIFPVLSELVSNQI